MTRTTDYLHVFVGEANENIVITTVDENGVAIDPSFGVWTTNSESKIELKTSDLSSVTTTLETTDFVSDNSTTVTMKIDKFGCSDMSLNPSYCI